MLQVATVVDLGDRELGVGEDVLGVGHLLQTQAVDGLDVGNSGDLVGLHDVEADPRHPGIGLVVDEQVLAVITTVGERGVGVVGVTVVETRGLAEDMPGLVGDAPAGGALGVEHRNAHQLAHGGDAQHPHFAGVAAAPEAVVFVEFTGGHHGIAFTGAGTAAAEQGAGANTADHSAGKAGAGDAGHRTVA